jgi:PAS domain S-box-containing protein
LLSVELGDFRGAVIEHWMEKGYRNMACPDDAVAHPSHAAAGGTVDPPGERAATLTSASRNVDVESGALHRLLVESVRDYAIFALDPEGYILTWNIGAERLKGYTPAEIVGRHFSVFYPAEEIAAAKPQRELEIAVRDGKYEEEGWRVRKDGSTFWASVLITALHRSDGALAGFAKVTRDLTERRAAQEKAIADARHIAEVESANRIKSEFLTAMSHELRTPINATKGYVELIEMGVGGPITDQHREYLKRIGISQNYLLRIITDLLNYGRIEAGRVQYDLAPVPVAVVVETVLPMVEPQAASKGLSIDYMPPTSSLVGSIDRTKAEQIVLNLLSNAVKFTPAGGRVTVACTATEHYVVITVTDTGPGIPPGQQAAIFDPFVQLGRTLASGHEGTGLGLAISRDLARAMGGDVTVESAQDQGASFALALPRV